MKIEYTPTAEDVYQLKRAIYRRARRQPAVIVMVAGIVMVSAGGLTMGIAGSPIWLLFALAGLAAAGAVALGMRKLTVSRARVEREYARRSWVRGPYSVELTDAGVTYAHGPFRARTAWPAFKSLVETDHHLVLLEHPGPAALVYGLSKRELERSARVAAWREFLRSHVTR